MLMTKRKPATIGEILVEEFMKPIGLTQGALAEAMGVQRKHVNELCNDRRNVTAATALILARVFGNSPDFRLNVQRRSDLWEAMHSPRERKRIERARPLTAAASASVVRAAITTIKKTKRATYPDVDGASHSREELLEKCADSERMNARDISAMIPPMLQLVGVHFQKERMAF